MKVVFSLPVTSDLPSFIRRVLLLTGRLKCAKMVTKSVKF